MIVYLYFILLIIFKYYSNYNTILMGIGDWGLGIGDCGLGTIYKPQNPIPKTQLKKF